MLFSHGPRSGVHTKQSYMYFSINFELLTLQKETCLVCFSVKNMDTCCMKGAWWSSQVICCCKKKPKKNGFAPPLAQAVTTEKIKTEKQLILCTEKTMIFSSSALKICPRENSECLRATLWSFSALKQYLRLFWLYNRFNYTSIIAPEHLYHLQ